MSHLSNAIRRELLLGWRTRASAIATFAFGATTLLLFSFAVGPNAVAMRSHAPGFLWLALLLSSTLTLSESVHAENEQKSLETLLLLPVPPESLFYGKALVNTFQLILLGCVLGPLMVVLYDFTPAGAGQLVGLIALGSAGLAAPGTLYASMVTQARGKQALLPLLLFPLVVPVLLASVKATVLLSAGDPMNQSQSWVILLICFDAIYWSLCGLLYGRVVQE